MKRMLTALVSLLLAVPAGAVIGMNAYGTDEILWFDAENAAAILAHADPLTLAPETGAMTTAEGIIVAAMK